MRLLLALAPLLIAGCLGSGPQAQPQTQPISLLPPSLLIDRGATNASLQVYVHAKQGNVRYDAIVITPHVAEAAAPNATLVHQAVYAVDVQYDRAQENFTITAFEGPQRYQWDGNVALNLTAPSIAVSVLDPQRGWLPAVNATLPYETLLQLVEARR
ncbi:MAG: hypothetical protein LC624_09045 [Halobacteriales archaeon]|nr:hypothetical protein [Halobacteriales archaeon]